MKVKGVNLGNWLVLEKWMSPALFAGTTAEDEYYLPRQLSKEVYEARIKIHRAEYITERDFVTIKSMGMEAVRIPVPYFIFGDREPFIGCVEELDKAFNWAEAYGLQILIDLHTAPLGQNGFDNGGICGVCKWAQHPEEVEFILSVLERLANTGYIRKNNTLLDYGCGKGRVDFFLSYQTRCRSIGIEYDERIYQKAIENKDKAVSGGRTSMELANAEIFAVPENADRMYFFNPFPWKFWRK